MIINQINYEKEKKKYNSFLALLRMYLSFNVVNNHCFCPSNYTLMNKYIILILKNRICVPTFFLMSFYFSHKLFFSKNIEKINNRFERLLIPYLVWPIIIWVLNNFINYTLNLKLRNSLNDLIIQLMTGHCFMTVLWFHYNLIFSTLLIIIIQFLFLDLAKLILLNLCIFSYYFQYSNLNFIIFSKYNFYKKYSFGRFFEIIPYCIIGLFIGYFNIIIYLRKYRISCIYFLLLILIFIIKYNIFINIKGFMYQGIILLIKSSLIFLIFLLMPSEKINNKYIINIIKIFTDNTSGIYFLHTNIRDYIKNYIRLIKNNTLYGSIIIYIICYIISFFGIKILGKTKYRSLFQ